MSTGVKVAIILGVVIILAGILGCVLITVVFKDMITGPADTANGYVEALDEGDLSTAWDYITPSTQSQETRSGFETKVSQFEGKIKKWYTTSVNTRNNTSKVVMSITFNDGSTATWDMTIIKSGGEWKIDQVSPR